MLNFPQVVQDPEKERKWPIFGMNVYFRRVTSCWIFPKISSSLRNVLVGDEKAQGGFLLAGGFRLNCVLLLLALRLMRQPNKAAGVIHQCLGQGTGLLPHFSGRVADKDAIIFIPVLQGPTACDVELRLAHSQAKLATIKGREIE